MIMADQQMNNNLSYKLAYEISVDVFNLFKAIKINDSDLFMKNCVGQVSRSVTSVPANLTEGATGSKKNLLHKIRIALGELLETIYWINLLCSTGYLTEEAIAPVIDKCNHLRNILYKSIKTLNSKMAKEEK